MDRAATGCRALQLVEIHARENRRAPRVDHPRGDGALLDLAQHEIGAQRNDGQPINAETGRQDRRRAHEHVHATPPHHPDPR